jgi:hypothetical protein
VGKLASLLAREDVDEVDEKLLGEIVEELVGLFRLGCESIEGVLQGRQAPCAGQGESRTYKQKNTMS